MRGISFLKRGFLWFSLSETSSFHAILFSNITVAKVLKDDWVHPFLTWLFVLNKRSPREHILVLFSMCIITLQKKCIICSLLLLNMGACRLATSFISKVPFRYLKGFMLIKMGDVDIPASLPRIVILRWASFPFKGRATMLIYQQIWITAHLIIEVRQYANSMHVHGVMFLPIHSY